MGSGVLSPVCSLCCFGKYCCKLRQEIKPGIMQVTLANMNTQDMQLPFINRAVTFVREQGNAYICSQCANHAPSNNAYRLHRCESCMVKILAPKEGTSQISDIAGTPKLSTKLLELAHARQGHSIELLRVGHGLCGFLGPQIPRFCEQVAFLVPRFCQRVAFLDSWEYSKASRSITTKCLERL